MKTTYCLREYLFWSARPDLRSEDLAAFYFRAGLR